MARILVFQCGHVVVVEEAQAVSSDLCAVDELDGLRHRYSVPLGVHDREVRRLLLGRRIGEGKRLIDVVGDGEGKFTGIGAGEHGLGRNLMVRVRIERAVDTGQERLAQRLGEEVVAYRRAAREEARLQVAQRHEHQQKRTSGAGGRHRFHKVAAVAPLQGLPLDRPRNEGEVIHAQEAVVVAHVAVDLLGDFAVVEGSDAVARDDLEDLGERGLGEALAGFEDFVAIAQEVAGRRRSP